MKLANMRFKGVSWHHNPRELSFTCDKYISEKGSPGGGSYIQSTGRKNLRIKGKGELFGEDCLEQFQRLFELFREGGSGILSIAKLSPVYAVFESLKITAAPKPDLLEYEFVFREVMEKSTRTSLLCTRLPTASVCGTCRINSGWQLKPCLSSIPNSGDPTR